MEQLFADGADSPLVLMVLAGLVGGFFLLIALALGGGGKEKQFKNRLDQVKTGRRAPGKQEEKKVNARRQTSDSEIKAIDNLIKSMLPKREQLRLRLERAGFDVPLGRYLSVCIIVGCVLTVLALMLTPLPVGAAPFIAIVAGMGIPHMAVGFLGKRRQNKFISFFPDAIDLMVRGLKSGLPIGESIKTAGEEVPDPVGIELRKVTDAVRLGGKLEDVLFETAERLALQDFKFFTVSLAIQSETGGNLAETLSNLSNILRDRRKLKMKIKAMSSEAKASTYIIGSLPFVVGFFIYLVNTDYIMKLFTDSRGHVMLGAGGLSFVIGISIMYKMVKFEI